MLSKYIKRQNTSALFICSISESSLKVIKCLSKKNAKREFTDALVEPLDEACDEKAVSAKLTLILKRLGFNNNPFIFSLSRQSATVRYLKVPAQDEREIEKIAALQAARYLPYPANELVTAYQVISKDKDGYSNINLVIAHKGIISRLIRILQGLGIREPAIILSSFGLSSLYAYLHPQEGVPELIIDIDAREAEIAIARKENLLFSRAFKLNRREENWLALLAQETKKTIDTYLKEKIDSRPEKGVIFHSAQLSGLSTEDFSQLIGLPVRESLYWEKIPAAKNFLSVLSNTDCSLASLAGLWIKEAAPNLNLLPQEMKEGVKKASELKERLRLALSIAAILLILGLGIGKNNQNKAQYLKLLKQELGKIEGDARSLEEIDKRFNLLESRLKKKPTSLEVIYELCRLMPDNITLSNLIYEEDGQVALRGNTLELNSVFSLVSHLEKSAVFKGFNVKVRYATKKRTQAGEAIDFEIICARK